MAKPTKEELYAWMDKQIEACEIQNTPVDAEDPFYIMNASGNGRRIHVYHVENLCKELNLPCRIEEHSVEYNRYHFMYRGYRFFGLVKKEDNNEGQ